MRVGLNQFIIQRYQKVNLSVRPKNISLQTILRYVIASVIHSYYVRRIAAVLYFVLTLGDIYTFLQNVINSNIVSYIIFKSCLFLIHK